jgi:hypothetical protein
MSEKLDRCSTCKNAYLKPTGEVILEGESTGEFTDIGSKRVYQCDNCKKRRIRVGLLEYVELSANVKTELEIK